MTIIIKFEKSCGTFRGGVGKNPLSSVTLGQFDQKLKKLFNFFEKTTMTMGWMLT